MYYVLFITQFREWKREATGVSDLCDSIFTFEVRHTYDSMDSEPITVT
jgi:hypothetical protein